MVIAVAPWLTVGCAADYERDKPEGAVIQACKEPYHRKALGYISRGAPKHSPEYLFCYRGNRLILNIVDVDNPAFISPFMVDEAVRYARENRANGVFIHCNQGRSRSPVLAMLALARELPAAFEEAEEAMQSLYPPYDPARGVRDFAKAAWGRYHGP